MLSLILPLVYLLIFLLNDSVTSLNVPLRGLSTYTQQQRQQQQPLPTMHSRQRSTLSTLTNGKLLVFGGLENTHSAVADNDLIIIDLERNVSNSYTLPQVQRFGHTTSFGLDSELIVLFGAESDFPLVFPTDNFVSLTASSEKYETKSIQYNSSPPSRHGHSANQLKDGSILVYGGYIQDPASRRGKVDNHLYMLDTSGTWSNITQGDSHTVARAYHSSFLALNDEYLFTCLGIGNVGNPLGDCVALRRSDGKEVTVEYESSNQTYPVIPRAYATLNVMGESVIIFGGCDINEDKYYADVFRAEVKMKNVNPVLYWEKVVPKGEGPEARCQHSSLAVDGKVVIWGGIGFKEEPMNGKVHVLDTVKMEWVDAKELVLEKAWNSWALALALGVFVGVSVALLLWVMFRRSRKPPLQDIEESEKRRTNVSIMSTTTGQSESSSEELLAFRDGPPGVSATGDLLSPSPALHLKRRSSSESLYSSKFASLGGIFRRQNPPARSNYATLDSSSSGRRTLQALNLHTSSLSSKMEKVPRRYSVFQSHFTLFIHRFYRPQPLPPSPFPTLPPRNRSNSMSSMRSVESLQWVSLANDKVVPPKAALTIRNKSSLEQFPLVDLSDGLTAC